MKIEEIHSKRKTFILFFMKFMPDFDPNFSSKYEVLSDWEPKQRPFPKISPFKYIF